MNRRARAAALALSVGALLAPAVQAPAKDHSTPSATAASPGAPLSSGGIYVTGTELADSISAWFDPATDEYVIEGPPGFPVQGDQCYAESAYVARCPALTAVITVRLGAGDDVFQALPRPWPMTSFRIDGEAGDDALLVGFAGPTQLWGRSGDDNLVAGPLDDELRGGGGSDRLVGSAGSDYLAGGHGADRFLGGDDADRIIARDREADIDIQCGSDHAPNESVSFDRALDPKPRGCHLYAKAFTPIDGRYRGEYTSGNHGPGTLRLRVEVLRPGLHGVRLLKWSGELQCPGHRTRRVDVGMTAARVGRKFSGYVTYTSPPGKDSLTGRFTARDALKATVSVTRGSGAGRCDTGPIKFVAHRVAR